MIQNYLKSALRHFLRHRFFSFLNILGLAVGFACSLMLALFVWQEATFDTFHEKGDRIARVIMEYKVGDRSAEIAVTGTKVADVFVKEMPEVESAVRFAKFPVVVSRENTQFEEDRFVWADSTFFDVFTFPLVMGDPNKALAGPNRVVLTPETAHRYFGDQEAIGETILVGKTIYEVTGIIEEAPVNSQIKYDFIASFTSLSAATKEPEWFSANYFTYLLLHSPQSIEQLEAKIFDFMKTKSEETEMTGENYLTYHLEPLREVHLKSSLSGLEPTMDRRYVIIFAIVTFLILIIACINYMNLATARAADRGTEVGVRKVMGAQRTQLFWQFITESFISIAFAAALAWVLASLLMPYFNDVLSKQYTLDIFITPVALSSIAAILVLVGFGAGAYPALVLTHFSPAKTLKGSFKTSKAGLNLRRCLVIFQFVISAALIISSLVIYQQIKFIQTTNLGYQKENIIVQSLDRDVISKYDAFKAQLTQIPQVEEVTMVHETPTYINWGDGMQNQQGEGIMVTANPVEYNYLKTFKIKLLAGEDFSKQDQVQANSDSAQVLNSIGRNIIINQKAAEILGFTATEAIGQKVPFKGNATIIGVMDNFYFAPLHEEIAPLVLFVDQMYNQVVIRLKGDDTPSTLALIGEEWNKIAPHIPYEPQFLNEEYNAMYESEENLGKLFLFFTVIAIVLGVLGLLGLSALMISHRTREIGIRKVMGASVGQIVEVLSMDFLKLVIIAFVLSIPIAWYFMDMWLQTFVYRISMPWYLFLASGLGLILLTLATLSTQTVRAAIKNPTEVIRNE